MLLPLIFVMLAASASGESIEKKYPLSKFLGGDASFAVAGNAELIFEQAGDSTKLILGGKVIEKIDSPQFVEGVVLFPRQGQPGQQVLLGTHVLRLAIADAEELA